jgi:hypothetical protein
VAEFGSSAAKSCPLCSIFFGTPAPLFGAGGDLGVLSVIPAVADGVDQSGLALLDLFYGALERGF